MPAQSHLLDHYGRPIILNKKSAPPVTGEAFGNWAGRDLEFMTLPGGGVVQFDLSKLVLSDFRAMRDHYQINVSLSVLAFMQHQSDFHIECEDKKIAELCDRQLREIWTQLNRQLAQANWAGYSPGILQWENDVNDREVKLDKIKDLLPEECYVNWKEVEGWAPAGHIPPKLKVYDGLRQLGAYWPIPVKNSFWYPMLMENGDYTGRKLLRPAFQSWFFSLLLHLFANRYYERFGEPTPIGRAPYDENLDVPDGSGGVRSVPGNQFMLELLQNLRSRSVVVLPNEKTQDETGRSNFDYDIDYLESQMRGADFERYLTRLDEEMSLGLFTPILLMRTADVGSYNLGVGHMQMYLWMMNALNGDRKQYIDKYILSRMVDFNFSEKAPRAKVIFRKLGNADTELIRDLIAGMVAKGEIKPDITELGEIAGMTLKQIRQTVADPEATDDPDAEPNGDKAPAGTNTPGRATTEKDAPANTAATVTEILARVRPQVENAFRDGRFGAQTHLNMGFKRRMVQSMMADGVSTPDLVCERFYSRMDGATSDMLQIAEDFKSPDDFMRLYEGTLSHHLNELTRV